MTANTVGMTAILFLYITETHDVPSPFPLTLVLRFHSYDYMKFQSGRHREQRGIEES
jgi:hypothetical protein